LIEQTVAKISGIKMDDNAKAKLENIPDISFNVSPPIIVFNRFPFSKDLFLHNKSTVNSAQFYIQASPPNFFTASPAFGLLKKGEATHIVVKFNPSPLVSRKTSEVNGFLRVRSGAGFPLERSVINISLLIVLFTVHYCRISLKAYNLPAIKSYPDFIDFGFCPVGETRVSTFFVENLLPIECHCVLLILNSITPSFSVGSSQTVFQPKEKKSLSIKFNPTVEGAISDSLVLVAFGGEVSKIQLKGHGGESVLLIDKSLDFGPTDIFYGSVSRRLFLQNRDLENEYPIFCETTTNEISINHNQQLSLAPGEMKQVNVSFLSKISGNRQETVQLYAPNSQIPPIEATVSSGQLITIPVMENIYFPTCLTKQSSIVQIPITNTSSNMIQVSLSTPVQTLFTMRLVDPDFSNKKPVEKINLAIDMKPFENKESSGVILNIGPRLTAVLEVSFLSPVPGTYGTQLTATLTKPRKMVVSVHNLFAISLNESYLTNYIESMDTLQKFLHSPNSEALNANINPQDHSKLGEATAYMKSSLVLEFDPYTPLVYIPLTSNFNNDQMYYYATLNNLTNIPQKYRIILSQPFYTDINPIGVLDELSALEIPIKVNRNLLKIDYEKETVDYTFIGQITVFDGADKTGFVSCQVHGNVRDLISVDVRANCDSISFPPLRVMEKSSRKFFIRNKSPYELVWEGRMSLIGRRLNTGSSTSGGLDWCPFSVGTTRLTLKPFEYTSIDILFQATGTGDYHARLSMSYLDPITSAVNNEQQKLRKKRDLPTVDFECFVGMAEIEIEPTCLDFGDVNVGDTVSKSIILKNILMLSSPVSTICPQPFSIAENLILVPRNHALDVDIYFRSVKPRPVFKVLAVSCKSVTQIVSLFANAGFSIMSSNLAIPVKVNNAVLKNDLEFQDNNCIDFGTIATQSLKSKVISFQNLGTFDFYIKNIHTGPDSSFKWKFVDDLDAANDAKAFENHNEPLTSVEQDWDEIDFKIKEEKQMNQNLTSGNVLQLDASKNKDMKKKKGKQVQQTTISAIVNKIFPIRLAPLQKLDLQIFFHGVEQVIYRFIIIFWLILVM
jgi:hypothetical protein